MKSSNRIKIFTVKWCPHCMALLSFLNTEGIAFENFDVEESDEKWREAMALTGGMDIVPVVEINGKTLFGAFTPDFKARLYEYLDLKKR